MIDFHLSDSDLQIQTNNLSSLDRPDQLFGQMIGCDLSDPPDQFEQL